MVSSHHENLTTYAGIMENCIYSYLSTEAKMTISFLHALTCRKCQAKDICDKDYLIISLKLNYHEILNLDPELWINSNFQLITS